MTLGNEIQVKNLETKLQVVINRLIYLQDLISKVNVFVPVGDAETNKIALASSSVCDAYIDVLRAVGISDNTLARLGFDSCESIMNIEPGTFLRSLNALLKADICDKQRAVLVNGAADTCALLDAGHALKSARPTVLFKTRVSGFELFCAFATAALINSSQLAAAGYIINDVRGAKLGAALGLLVTSVEKLYTEAHSGELTQVKYTLAHTTNAFREGVHAYKYNMHPKDLLTQEVLPNAVDEMVAKVRPLAMVR